MNPQPPPANPAKEYLVNGLPPAPEPEIDVRGVRLEEALRIVGDRLDRAILHRMPSLRVIHGHGTGRLRDGLRRHLRQAAGVRAIEDAPPDQGGNGATVILLDS